MRDGNDKDKEWIYFVIEVFELPMRDGNTDKEKRQWVAIASF